MRWFVSWAATAFVVADMKKLWLVCVCFLVTLNSSVLSRFSFGFRHDTEQFRSWEASKKSIIDLFTARPSSSLNQSPPTRLTILWHVQLHIDVAGHRRFQKTFSTSSPVSLSWLFKLHFGYQHKNSRKKSTSSGPNIDYRDDFFTLLPL